MQVVGEARQSAENVTAVSSVSAKTVTAHCACSTRKILTPIGAFSHSFLV